MALVADERNSSGALSPDYLFGRELDLGDAELDLTEEDWMLRDEKGRIRSIRAGFPLYSQGRPAGIYHYSLEFGVENLSPEDELFLLELGPVYQSDETRLNGHLVGSYGPFPPVFSKANRMQQIVRRYVVPREWLHWDRANQLEIKVDTGIIGGTIWYAGGGIFQGPVRLIPIRQRVLVDYALRDPSLPSVTPLLSDAAHLNRFLENEDLHLRVRLAQLSPIAESSGVEVEVRLMGDGPSLLRRTESPGAGRWSEWESMRLPMPPPGQHDCEIVVRSGEEILYQKTISFEVEENLPSMNVVRGFHSREIPDSLVWQEVSSRTVGSFGARASNEKGVLDPVSWEQDVRGTLTSVLHVDRDSSRPLLLFPGVQQPPLTPFNAADYQEFPLGREYDGFGDTWPLGFVRMGSDKKGSSSLRFADWVSRRYHFADERGRELGEMMISKLSPAFRMVVNTGKVVFFDDLDLWGLEGPSHMAFSGHDGVQVLERGDRFNGADLAENWVLVWFHGAAGWEDFDVPWLFVFDQIPGEVALSANGLAMRPGRDGSSAVLYGMPLYGVRLVEPVRTKEWKNGPGAEVLEDIRRWSGTLPTYPEGLERSVAVDWQEGEVYVRDRIRHLPNRSEDFPQARKSVPVPPVMALGIRSDNLEITASDHLEDFHLVTAYGPFLAGMDTDS